MKRKSLILSIITLVVVLAGVFLIANPFGNSSAKNFLKPELADRVVGANADGFLVFNNDDQVRNLFPVFPGTEFLKSLDTVLALEKGDDLTVKVVFYFKDDSQVQKFKSYLESYVKQLPLATGYEANVTTSGPVIVQLDVNKGRDTFVGKFVDNPHWKEINVGKENQLVLYFNHLKNIALTEDFYSMNATIMPGMFFDKDYAVSDELGNKIQIRTIIYGLSNLLIGLVSDVTMAGRVDSKDVVFNSYFNVLPKGRISESPANLLYLKEGGDVSKLRPEDTNKLYDQFLKSFNQVKTYLAANGSDKDVKFSLENNVFQFGFSYNVDFVKGVFATLNVKPEVESPRLSGKVQIEEEVKMSGEAYFGLDATKSPLSVVVVDNCPGCSFQEMNNLTLNYHDKLAFYYVMSDEKYFNLADQLECAGQQANFGAGLKALYGQSVDNLAMMSGNYDLDNIQSEIAKTSGMDMEKFKQCLSNPSTRATVVSNYENVMAVTKNIKNSPFAIVGKTVYLPGTTFLDLQKIESAIDAILKSK